MTFVRKLGSEYYLCRYGKHFKNERKERIPVCSWFFIKSKVGANDDSYGYISTTKDICLPNELIGKKIRIKVEIIDEELEK